MKKGICPNCGGKDIWMTRETGREASFMIVSLLSSINRDTYCCISCGLTQSFIREEELANPEAMAKLRKKFTPVQG